MPLALTDFDPEQLEREFARHGCKASHVRPLLRSFYLNGGRLDLPKLKVGKRVEGLLSGEIIPRRSQIILRNDSADGTVKLLIGFSGGGAVESVLMPAYDGIRAAGCVSSQIGCAMGCDFCASTRGGLERNLEAGEIVEQFLHLRAEAKARGRRLATLVFMGMGEPMHNLTNVIAAIRRIAAPNLGELGWRQITVSTVGVVPGIDALADADLNVQLALSLHAPDDPTRLQIVPMNRKYGVAEIMAAAKRFQERTRRVVNIEYCLLAGMNDSDEHAARLAELMRDFRAHVNLIPYNAIGPGLSGRSYRAPDEQRAVAFLKILMDARVVAHIRRPRGDDVSAACGQLRRQHANEA